MKIFIIGISGSGKTYLSKKLSEIYGIEARDLDDIFWEEKYTKKRSEGECQKILENEIKDKKDWIYEGIYDTWTKKLMEDADKIIWLDMPKNLMTYRIIKRWWDRRKETTESILEMLSLVKFQRNYRKIRKGKVKSFYQSHRENLEKYKDKLIILKTQKDFDDFIEGLE